MATILALDTSTKTGVCVLSDDPNFIFATELEAKNLNGFQRLAWFRAEVTKLLEAYKPELVVIEGYGYGNAHTLVTLVEIGTMCRMACSDFGVPLVLVPPTNVKSFLLGKGVGQKDLIMLEVFKRWGFSAPTNNIADAYILARIGKYLMGYDTVTKAAAATIDKIESVKVYKGVSEKPVKVVKKTAKSLANDAAKLAANTINSHSSMVV